jgi:hypothetical protein
LQAGFSMATIDEHAVSPLNTGSAFVIMQIGCQELDHVYSVVISPALAACGLIARRIDKHNEGGLLESEIITGIRTADIIVADLTNERPNCYLEVGYFNQDLGPRAVAQNFLAAHNAGIGVVWTLPLILQSL